MAVIPAIRLRARPRSSGRFPKASYGTLCSDLSTWWSCCLPDFPGMDLNGAQSVHMRCA